MALTDELHTLNTNRAGSAQTLRPMAQEVSTPMQTTQYCHCGCGLYANPGRRYIYGHRWVPPLTERFVEQQRGFTSPCWVWQGTITTRGYGQIWDIDARRMRVAHRFMWEEANGPVPEGLELDHLCRVRACCNPEHLEPVTRRENVHRGSATKVTDDQAREIRRRRQAGEEAASIAKDYPISRSSVYAIALGQCRKHLDSS